MNIGKYRDLTASINNINKGLSKVSTQISSQKEYNKGSENISNYSLQLITEKKLNNLNDITKDMEHASKILQASEVNINSIEDVISKTYRELMKVSSNGEYKKEDRNIIKNMLISFKKEIVNISNAKVDGQYVFSGQFTNRKPFDLDKSVIDPVNGRKIYNYNGSELKKTVYVDENVKSEYGVTGKQLISDTKILTILDNMIEIMNNPVSAISNQLSYESLDTMDSLTNPIYVKERVNYENLSGITAQEIKEVDDYIKKLQDFNKGDTTNTLSDLAGIKNQLLTEPIFSNNPDGINKMYDVSTYIDNLREYNDTNTNESFRKTFDKYIILKNDTNNTGSPYTDDEKENFRYMLEIGNYNKKLNEYVKSPTSDLFEEMQLNNQYMKNNLPNLEAENKYNLQEVKNMEIQIDFINDEIQNDSSLSASVKSDYQTYNQLAHQYLNDQTTSNKDAFDNQKALLDSEGLGAAQDAITQKIQDMVDYVPDSRNKWVGPELTNAKIDKAMDGMFNLAKNPLSNNLSEWEEVRNKVSLLHSEIGNQTNYFEQVLNRAGEQHLNLEIFYKENIEVDLSEAAMTLQNKSNSLTALYSVISKIQSLSLTKYI